MLVELPFLAHLALVKSDAPAPVPVPNGVADRGGRDRCPWCGEPVEDPARAMVISGRAVHLDPERLCVLELAHDEEDVGLCYHAALAVIGQLAARPAGSDTGSDTQTAMGMPCASPTGLAPATTTAASNMAPCGENAILSGDVRAPGAPE